MDINKDEIYPTFKLCLLIDGQKTTKDFADIHTQTSAQHVTMVANGTKTSAAVMNHILNYIDFTLSKPENLITLQKLIDYGKSIRA